jgi:hypothetical protein
VHEVVSTVITGVHPSRRANSSSIDPSSLFTIAPPPIDSPNLVTPLAMSGSDERWRHSTTRRLTAWSRAPAPMKYTYDPKPPNW